MLFPGSRIWYEGSAVDLANLTDEIKASGFSGHIVLEFQDSLDLVICVGGEFQKVIEKIGRRLLSTKKYREIWGKCQIKTGRMLVFELPPALAYRLRGLHGRRLLCSGSAATGIDPHRLLRERKDAGFTGIIDCVAPEGKMLLDFESGTIHGCYYTEYEGLFFDGLEAFRAWHGAFLRARQPSHFFVSEIGSRRSDGQHWDELLMESAELVSVPLRSSLERLFRFCGREASPDEVVFSPASALDTAVYLLEGEVELISAQRRVPALYGLKGPGDIIGLGLLGDLPKTDFIGRARSRCRYLAFNRGHLPTIFHNSPMLAARCVRDAVRLTHLFRGRLAAYREEPRLRDVERAVAEALHRPENYPGGITAAELFRELTQSLPFSLPEIDALFRKLVGLGSIEQSGGKVIHTPQEL